ncbi:MAG: polynucleotide adenylyltransferase [Bacilli bacterium]
MDEELSIYLKLFDVFSHNGYSLYLVGGTVRNFLLSLPIDDVDMVTNATPAEMKIFLERFQVDYTFHKLGSIKLFFEGHKFDITTLRTEKRYRDSRHPERIKFVTTLKKDYKRRDFTINAMYMDEHFRVIDYVDGIDDINHRLIKMVGNPFKRIKEDPLRIMRAIRFSLDLDFEIDELLKRAMKKYSYLLLKLNIEKIKQDIHKIKNKDKQIIAKKFDEYNIHYLLDMIE